jgi:hypothetical protein
VAFQNRLTKQGDTAKENYGKFDLAIGVDNAFAISDSLADISCATELK